MAGAADTAQIPSDAQIANAPLLIGFKTAAGQDHGLGGDLAIAVFGAHDDAGHSTVAGLQQADGGVAIADFDPHLFGAGHFGFDQTGAAANGFDIHAAVEMVFSVHFEGLAAEHGDKADRMAAQPPHRHPGPVDQQLRQLFVTLIPGHFPHLIHKEFAAMRGQDDLIALGLA